MVIVYIDYLSTFIRENGNQWDKVKIPSKPIDYRIKAEQKHVIGKNEYSIEKHYKIEVPNNLFLLLH